MSLTHRKSKTRLYRIWKCMRGRCNNPNRKEYMNYGGRGIKVCSDWDDYKLFEKWAMNNGYEETLTIDRIDVNGAYEPNNCRWIEKEKQALNRRNSIKIQFNGKLYTPLEVSNITGISVNTIYDAIRKQHITDFTEYHPKSSEHKNITCRRNGYEVTIKGKYIGKYKTLEEAIIIRNDWINEHGNMNIRY